MCLYRSAKVLLYFIECSWVFIFFHDTLFAESPPDRANVVQKPWCVHSQPPYVRSSCLCPQKNDVALQASPPQTCLLFFSFPYD